MSLRVVWRRGTSLCLSILLVSWPACMRTGSCAAAAALHHWGRTGTAVTIHQPGGSVAVELRADGTAVLSGPSERIAACTVEA